MSGPLYFETPAQLRAWFEKNHQSLTEVSIGYFKKGSGLASITWPESVDQALCFGWIDGVRHSIDGKRYRIRFTPRKRTSIWSEINIGRVKELTKRGLMTPAGLEAFKARDPKRAGIYSFEQKTAPTLPAAFTQRFKANAKAWAYFTARAPGYQRVATHWVVSAKREETKDRRLATRIECSAEGRLIPQLIPRPGKP